jgi:hypothetical protein
MTQRNIERRKYDQERWDEIRSFMARIDQRNIDKDLNYAIQGDVVAEHEKRIVSLEHTRTKYNTIGMGLTSIGFGTWVIKKLGHLF